MMTMCWIFCVGGGGGGGGFMTPPPPHPTRAARKAAEHSRQTRMQRRSTFLRLMTFLLHTGRSVCACGRKRAGGMTFLERLRLTNPSKLKKLHQPWQRRTLYSPCEVRFNLDNHVVRVHACSQEDPGETEPLKTNRKLTLT